MKHCDTRGCANPAFGRFAATTKYGVEYHDWCGACGFNAHNKRKLVVIRDNGREDTFFPRRYTAVELVEIFGDTYDGPKVIKPNPKSAPLARLIAEMEQQRGKS